MSTLRDPKTTAEKYKKEALEMLTRIKIGIRGYSTENWADVGTLAHLMEELHNIQEELGIGQS